MGERLRGNLENDAAGATSGKGFPFLRGRGPLLVSVSLSASLLALLIAASPGIAVVTGSPHDFSAISTVAPSGVCSACHIPHGADSNAPLWSRSLSLYVSRLTMNGDTSGKPNYILPPALACYDCHDDHGAIDDIPSLSAFSSGYKPQDIAFGGDGPGGTKAGYYEHNPPNPSGGSYGVYSYPGQFNPATPDNLAKTGGHYFKTDPNSSARPDIGDKLPCRDCHDPHSSLQAFIRTGIPSSGANPGLGSSYTSVTASTYMTNNTGRTRSNAESRKICVQCHGYSNNGTPLKFSQISTAYTNSSDNVPKPPNTVSDHNSSASSACVSCHNHNSVGASCTTCHGYPPPGYPAGNTPSAYGAGADSHTKHVSGYSLTCGICHSDNTHQDNVVQVAFDPVFLGGKLSSGTDDNTSVPPGGTRCQNLYCHSSGRDGITPSTDSTHYAKYATLQWGVMNGQIRCNGCHGAFANDNVAGDFSADNTTMRYGAPNYRNSGTPGSATSNSHKAHVGTYECSVCHGNVASGYASQSRSITNATLHVNGSRDINLGALGSFNSNPGVKSCTVSCHGGSSPQWGGTISGCESCHAGAAGSDLEDYIFGNGTIATIDNVQWMASGHGRTTAYPGSGRAGAAKACTDCHDAAVAHNDSANPFRILSVINGNAVALNQPDTICRACHPQSGIRSHTQADLGASGYTTLRSWGTWSPRCVDCHDPHGDQGYWMIRDAINRQTNQGTYGTGSQASPNVANLPVVSKAQLDPSTAKSAGVCDYCHVNTAHNLSGSGTDAIGHNEGTDCIACHTHATGFMPSGCEGCHGNPPYGAAPNVMTTGDNSYNYWTQSGHGRWANDNSITDASLRPTCQACHDIGQPSPSTHQDNVLNNQYTNMTSNTFHLKTSVNGVPTLPASASPDNTQVIADDFCWLACHQARNIKNHRHSTDPSRLVRFGRKGTYADPSSQLYPSSANNALSSYGKPAGGHVYTDSSLTTYAPTSGNWYAPCVACHDPHGTAATSLSGGTNRMVRGNFKSTTGTEFCDTCHK